MVMVPKQLADELLKLNGRIARLARDATRHADEARSANDRLRVARGALDMLMHDRGIWLAAITALGQDQIEAGEDWFALDAATHKRLTALLSDDGNPLQAEEYVTEVVDLPPGPSERAAAFSGITEVRPADLPDLDDEPAAAEPVGGATAWGSSSGAAEPVRAVEPAVAPPRASADDEPPHPPVQYNWGKRRTKRQDEMFRVLIRLGKARNEDWRTAAIRQHPEETAATFRAYVSHLLRANAIYLDTAGNWVPRITNPDG